MYKNENLFRSKGITHLFFCDIDFLFVNSIKEEELASDGIVSVLHPGFPDSFCRDPKSTAYVHPSGNHPYYTGCFQGGELNVYLNMCKVIAERIDIDDRNGIMAVWNDESHYVKFLTEHPPAKVLTPAYAYPEEKYLRNKESWWTPNTVIKAKHLEKIDQHKWKNK